MSSQLDKVSVAALLERGFCVVDPVFPMLPYNLRDVLQYCEVEVYMAEDDDGHMIVLAPDWASSVYEAHQYWRMTGPGRSPLYVEFNATQVSLWNAVCAPSLPQLKSMLNDVMSRGADFKDAIRAVARLRNCKLMITFLVAQDVFPSSASDQ